MSLYIYYVEVNECARQHTIRSRSIKQVLTEKRGQRRSPTSQQRHGGSNVLAGAAEYEHTHVDTLGV